MNKKLSKILIISILVLLLAVGVFFSARYYAYNGGKRDLKSEEVAYTLTAKEFVAKFVANETEANKKYLEKPVAISGKITAVNNKEIILDEVVVCVLTAVDSKSLVGQTIAIKGRVIGYDDLMGSVNMDQCSINN
ncbi:hypothetical protein [Flavobacterium sp.]|uniref:OB-fold protein n=1 Tax=Flavobacterium sp. TaxID=239 RepID=UPI00333E4B26